MNAAAAYASAASKTTTPNPQCMAASVPAAALTTDAHPLTHHAHGTAAGRLRIRPSSPVGNGIPIRNAGGATTPTQMASFAASGKPTHALNNEGNAAW